MFKVTQPVGGGAVIGSLVNGSKALDLPNCTSHPSGRETEVTWMGTSLVAQWLRIRLPMQGTRVRAPVQEDPTCRGATKPVHHNY